MKPQAPSTKLTSRSRGVSIAIDYLFTVAVVLAVTTVVTAIFIGVVEDTEQEATEHELERAAGEIVTELQQVDAVMTRAENGATEIDEHQTAIELSGGFSEQLVQFTIEGDPGEQKLIARTGGAAYRIQLQLDRTVVTEGVIHGPVIHIECDCEDGSIKLT